MLKKYQDFSRIFKILMNSWVNPVPGTVIINIPGVSRFHGWLGTLHAILLYSVDDMKMFQW